MAVSLQTFLQVALGTFYTMHTYCTFILQFVIHKAVINHRLRLIILGQPRRLRLLAVLII